ncbi:MAG: FAD/NAD(P)-binding protein [bacterium]
MDNPYLPLPVRIKKITIENEAKDLKTFDLEFDDKNGAERFKYTCGQFAELSVLGAGEVPIGIASSPVDEGVVQFTVKKYSMGVVTSALHNLSEGDKIGIRGPFGNGFLMKEFEGSNLVIVGGGFALTTLRSLTKYILHEKNRSGFGEITVMVAARDPGEMLYKYDLEQWSKRDDIKLIRTIDRDVKGWTGKVGFAAPVLKEINPSSENAYAIVCGPAIMIKTCIAVLLKLRFKANQIFNSLEMRMKCGIGKCGRCNIGPKYVCKDGPVFSYAQLEKLPQEY